jgi:integrase
MFGGFFMSADFYLEHLDVKKYGGVYSIKYFSPIDGVQRRVPQKLTGPLTTKEEAIAWAKANLHLHLERELALAKRREWHSSREMVRLVSQYESYKRKQAPRSWQQEISVLKNFTLPYFVGVAGMSNPNTWHLEHQRFKSWLLDEARTGKGAKLSVSSANKAINSLNKFSEWLRDQARVLEWERFRPLSAYPASMQNRKGADDLVDEVEFNMVVAHLEPLWADMARVQYHTGMRVNEVLGLSLASLTTSTPKETLKAFAAIGEQPLGSIYLDSQPRDPYITRGEGGEIPRKALKWRKEISPKNARTIPISVSFPQRFVT